MHLQSIGVKDDWATPPKVFEWACREAGFMPELDVCATDETAKCPRWYTPLDNGLAQVWDGNFWMNPPYSKVGRWIKKAAGEVEREGVQGMALVFSKTDTKWFHSYVLGGRIDCELKFPRGRIRFLDRGREGPHPAPFPSMLIVMRPKEGAGNEAGNVQRSAKLPGLEGAGIGLVNTLRGFQPVRQSTLL